MFSWATQKLTGYYGAEAVQSVAKQTEEVPYTVLTKDHLQWAALDYTCVETQTFYFTTNGGHNGMLQLIYSNVANLRTTYQFNCKIFYPDRETPMLWTSDPVYNGDFDEDKFSFLADDVSLELSDDGSYFTIKSLVNEKSICDLKVTRVTPGFVVGKDGTTTFGNDAASPWGSMRHAFWPRCRVEGKIIAESGEIDCEGRGFFVHALQGMQPHQAASRWNFVNFQSPNYSAVMMEFTTPPTYGSVTVNVGGLTTDTKLLFAGASNSATHTESKEDPETYWPAPTAATYKWAGKSEGGDAIEAEIAGPLGERLDRIDVMGQIPGFVKALVATTVGTRPYIYQYAQKLPISLKIGDEVVEEEGLLYTEATFIS